MFMSGLESQSQSQSDAEISGVGGSSDVKERHQKARRRRNGYLRNFSEAKAVVSFPFRRAKKVFCRKKSNKGQALSSSSSSCCFPGGNLKIKTVKKVIFGSCCCFCFKQPPTAGSPAAESHTSDPNNPNFTFDMLKTLIENNDFYSRECNSHLLLDAPDQFKCP